MGGSIGSIAKTSTVLKGMNLSQTMLDAVSRIAGTGDQRAAFNAVLLATAANVSKKQNFNLELEINDLWIRLGNLRSATSPPAGSLSGLPRQLGQMSQMNDMLSTLARDLDAAMLNVVRNIK